MTQTEVKFVAEYCLRLQSFMLNGITEYFDEYGYHLVLMPKEQRKALKLEIVTSMYPYRKYFTIIGNEKRINYYKHALESLPE